MKPLDLEALFSYHAPIGTQSERYERIRPLGKALAETIMELCPPSAERTTAIRKVQEGVMWANASIAVNESAEDAMKKATPSS